MSFVYTEPQLKKQKFISIDPNLLNIDFQENLKTETKTKENNVSKIEKEIIIKVPTFSFQPIAAEPLSKESKPLPKKSKLSPKKSKLFPKKSKFFPKKSKLFSKESKVSTSLLTMGIYYKIPLSREALEAKQRYLWIISAIPSPYYNPLYGLGITFASFFTYNGCDPYIDYTSLDFFDSNSCRDLKKNIFYHYSPYLYQISAVVNIFFRGGAIEYHKHELTFDAPYIGGTVLRMYVIASFEENNQIAYHGYGDDSLTPLISPKDQSTYSSYRAYQNHLDEVGDDGIAFTHYNQYVERLASIKTIFSYSILAFFRLYGGIEFSYSRIRDYTGETVLNRNSEEGISVQTKLNIDCTNEIILACSPGAYFDLPIIIGFTIDWRDFEKNTQMGILFDTALEVSSTSLLSSFRYVRYYISPHFYVNPFITLKDRCNSLGSVCFPTRLVFAVRLLYSILDGDTALYVLNKIPTEFRNYVGLGGNSHLRGYIPGRFIGKTIMYGVLEARWSFLKLYPGFLFTLTPFFEFGRVFSDPFKFSLRELRFSYGFSLDIVWNESMTYRFQYALSSEGSYFSLNIGYIF